MTANERVRLLKYLEKQKHHPKLAKRMGVEVRMKPKAKTEKVE